MHEQTAGASTNARRTHPDVDPAGSEAGSPLLAIAPGPAQIVRSSFASSWQGILLEKHVCFPGERISASTDMHVISMFHGAPFRFDYRGMSGQFVGLLARPKSIMITPAGPVPDIRLHAPAEFIHCALNQKFAQRVMDELEDSTIKPIFRADAQDSSIQRILEMLMDELESERPLGGLYVESLAYALASRYLSLDFGRARQSEARAPSLLPRVLSRVREKIEANLETDLSLDSLAEDSGYSRSHFLRMFRAATGLTPHQYVLDLRLKRAQERLKQAGSSIVDVAISCGFSSQSHMTSVFRRRLEMTPAEFRRNA